MSDLCPSCLGPTGTGGCRRCGSNQNAPISSSVIQLLKLLPRCATCGGRADKAVTVLAPFSTYYVCRKHDTLTSGGTSTDLPWAEQADLLERFLGEVSSPKT